ncbi:MAG: diguanylate cyclase [Actinomycetota bacterium]
MTYSYFRNLALVFGLGLTLGTTLLIYLGYADPVEAMGQALFVLVLVFAVLYFQKGGGWAALAASIIYLGALLTIGPKTEAAYVWPAAILRITLYGFTGLAGGELCARVKKTLDDISHADLLDHETGLFTKEYFFKLVGSNIEVFERYDSPFSLLIFNFSPADLAKLSKTARQAALTAIGDELKESIRPSDEASRTTEDSFAVLLDQTAGKNADAVIARVNKVLKRVLGDDAIISHKLLTTPDDLEEIRTYSGAR